MLTVEMLFPAGRFHATPWGRNVNEGIPEWPPSPYRLLRAIYDVWKRKFPEWPVERVEPILAALASMPPSFSLPPVGAAHLRTFQSENLKDVAKKQKIVDAFVVVHPADTVLVRWYEVYLQPQESHDLDQLLRSLNYLGRSESWVSMRLVEEIIEVKWNCLPVEGSQGPGGNEVVRVACAVAQDAFVSVGDPKAAGRGGRSKKPDSWLEALAWSTGELLKSKRSDPPALRFLDYWRPTECFKVAPRIQLAKRSEVYGVLFGMHSTVPAHITTTLEFSERIRRKLIGLHRRVMGGDLTRVSPKFSGKDAEGKPLNGHRHVYILPLDRDRDGWLDHMLVVCKEPLSMDEQLCLDRLSSIWQPGGRPDMLFVPLCWGRLDNLFPRVKRIRSLTPFVAPRHYRKGRGPFLNWLIEELKREASNHYLPTPVRVNFIPALRGHGVRDIRWTEFKRSRQKDERPRPGYGFEVEFVEEVTMPVSLGYASHLGLGMFESTDGNW